MSFAALQKIPNGEFTGVLRSKSFGHFNPSRRVDFVDFNQFGVDFATMDLPGPRTCAERILMAFECRMELS